MKWGDLKSIRVEGVCIARPVAFRIARARPRGAGVVAVCLALLCLSVSPNQANAIGWGPTDFLIGGGPSFTTKIGVFDSSLNFKGYLDSNFITVEGMDFDAQGHLVAVASGSVNSVRVYDSSGAVVGGFTRQDTVLGAARDLKVTPNGNYIIATQNQAGADGAREFSPDGSLVRQYGSGNIDGVAVVPGNRVWIGGSTPNVQLFDLTSGMGVGSFSISGMTSAQSMSYSTLTNTVLMVNTGNSAIFEATMDGSIVRRFDAPGGPLIGAVTRGPNGDVFATTGGDQFVLRWHADGSFVGSIAMPSGFGPAGIVWAGNAPEPSSSLLVVLAASALLVRACRVG